jgi:hypothetical protein
VWRTASDTALKAVNGYTELPSGLIFEWGTLSYTANGGKFFNGAGALTTPFPTGCLNVTGSGNTNVTFDPTGSGNDDVVIFTGCGTSSFTFRLDSNDAATLSGTHVLSWFAVGY